MLVSNVFSLFNIIFIDNFPIRCLKFLYFKLKEKLKNKELPSTHPYYLLVVDICRRLVRGNKDVEEMKNQNWIVHVVQDPVKNAFVLPVRVHFLFSNSLILTFYLTCQLWALPIQQQIKI